MLITTRRAIERRLRQGAGLHRTLAAEFGVHAQEVSRIRREIGLPPMPNGARAHGLRKMVRAQDHVLAVRARLARNYCNGWPA